MSRRAALLIGVLVVAALVAAVVWLWPPERSACCGPSPAHTTGGGAETVPERPDEAFRLTVEYVFDGDTIRARPDSADSPLGTTGAVRIRLIGIDTPEGTPTVECGADEGRAHLRTLLPEGTQVWAATDQELWDRYDRALLYLWTDEGEFVNHELVASGDAVAIRVGANDRYYRLLQDAQTRAQAAGAGQWGAC